MKASEAVPLPEHTDGGAVMAGWVSLGWLSKLEASDPPGGGTAAAEAGVDRLLSA